jgi:hypothetical protein
VPYVSARSHRAKFAPRCACGGALRVLRLLPFAVLGRVGAVFWRVYGFCVYLIGQKIKTAKNAVFEPLIFKRCGRGKKSPAPIGAGLRSFIQFCKGCKKRNQKRQ